MAPCEDSSFSLVSRSPRQWASVERRSSPGGWKRNTMRTSSLRTAEAPPTPLPLPSNSLRIVVNEPPAKRQPSPNSSRSALSHWSTFLQSPDPSSRSGFGRSPETVIPPPRRTHRAPHPPLISDGADHRMDLACSDPVLSHASSTGSKPASAHKLDSSLQLTRRATVPNHVKEQLFEQFSHIVPLKVVEPLEQLVMAERLAKLRAVTSQDLFDGREEVLVQVMSSLEVLLTSAVTCAMLLGKHDEDVQTRATLADTVLAAVKHALYFDRFVPQSDVTEDPPRDDAFSIRFSEILPNELPSTSSRRTKSKWSLVTFKAALRESEDQCRSLKHEWQRSLEKNKLLEKLLAQHRSALGNFGQSRAGGGVRIGEGDASHHIDGDEDDGNAKQLLLFQAATFGAPTTAITLDTSGLALPTSASSANKRSDGTSARTSAPAAPPLPQQQPKLFLPPTDDWDENSSVLSAAHARVNSSTSLSNQARGELAQLGDHQSHTLEVVFEDNKRLHKRCRLQAEQLDVLRAQIAQQERQMQLLEKAVTDVTMENYELSLQIKTLLGKGSSPLYSPMLTDGRSAEMLATQSNLEIAKLLGMNADQLNVIRDKPDQHSTENTTRRRSSTRVPSVELLS